MEPDTQEPTSEENAAAQAAAEQAFSASFGTDDSPPPAAHESTEQTAPAKASPAAPAPKKDETPAKPTEPVADPYAGLPQVVRDRLAMVDDLEHKFQSLNGRFVALQRERAAPAPAASPAPAATPPAAPTRAKRDAVRGELPEVAEMADEIEDSVTKLLDERLAKLNLTPSAAPAPAPANAEGGVELTDDEKLLTELHPDWFKKLGSTDFALWLPTQQPAYAQRVRSANSAAVILDALTKFDGYTATITAQRAAEAEEAARRTRGRSNRVAAATQPARGGARPAAANPTDDEQAAFEAGFNDS